MSKFKVFVLISFSDKVLAKIYPQLLFSCLYILREFPFNGIITIRFSQQNSASPQAEGGESALFTSQAGHTVFTLLSLTLLDMEGQTGEETRPECPNVANDWVLMRF